MKTALLFPGQGAQYPSMLLDVAEAYPAAREAFDAARQATGRSLLAELGTLSQEELNQTVNTQPCMLACELASLRALQSLGVAFDAAAGFALGEWAAVVAAGVMTERDAMRLIVRRAEAMQRAVPAGEGGMAYILGKDDDFVARLCEEIGDIVPANYNIQGNVSVAGTSEGIARFLARSEQEGYLAGKIAVSIPSHCWLMQPAVDALKPLIEKLEMQPPKARLLMNATGETAADVAEIRENLALQLIQPVRFRKIVDSLLSEGFDTFIEAGPGNTLSKMVKKAAKQQGYTVSVLQAGKAADFEKIKAALGGATT